MEADIVITTQEHMQAIKDAVTALRADRATAVDRIAVIDTLLSDLGEFARPKRGRPRKSKSKGEAVLVAG